MPDKSGYNNLDEAIEAAQARLVDLRPPEDPRPDTIDNPSLYEEIEPGYFVSRAGTVAVVEVEINEEFKYLTFRRSGSDTWAHYEVFGTFNSARGAITP